MFGKTSFYIAFWVIVLLSAGCGASLDVPGGHEPNFVLNFDNEYEQSETLEKGELIGLTMRRPTQSGYKLVGASFDPDILKLVHFYDYEEDGVQRAAWVLEAVDDGLSEVLIKMVPLKGGKAEVYKRASINVGEREFIKF